MKILLICENPLEKIGEQFFAVDSWMRFHMNLSKHCEKLTLLAPVKICDAGASPSAQAWRVDQRGFRIVALDYYNSFVTFYRLWLKRGRVWKREAERLVSEHDAVLIFHPSPMTPMISRIASKQKKPFVILLAGDLKAQSDRILGRVGFKQLCYKVLVRLWVWQEVKAGRRAEFVYAYSKELVARHQNGTKPVVKLARDLHTTLDDFFYREDTCQGSMVRLVRVCWLLPSKGIEYLFESIALLVKRGLPVQLDLIGQERTKGYQSKLEELAVNLGIREAVTFHGWVPFDGIGPYYINSDIQIISSLAEGTPRVIVEGGARGVPLVTTAVGGCPDALDHESSALIVPPADPVAMADAIERVVRDDSLRRHLIKTGYAEAKKATFEHKGVELLSDLESVLPAA
jgi:glycosyltransferase involved in cell wall biosynthesis